MEKFKELKRLYEQEKKREIERQEISNIIAKLEQKKKELERKLKNAKQEEGQFLGQSPDITEMG